MASPGGSARSGDSATAGDDSSPPPPQDSSSAAASNVSDELTASGNTSTDPTLQAPSSSGTADISLGLDSSSRSSAHRAAWEELAAGFSSHSSGSATASYNSEDAVEDAAQYCVYICCPCFHICELFRSCWVPRLTAAERRSGDQVPNIRTQNIGNRRNEGRTVDDDTAEFQYERINFEDDANFPDELYAPPSPASEWSFLQDEHQQMGQNVGQSSSEPASEHQGLDSRGDEEAD